MTFYIPNFSKGQHQCDISGHYSTPEHHFFTFSQSWSGDSNLGFQPLKTGLMSALPAWTWSSLKCLCFQIWTGAGPSRGHWSCCYRASAVCCLSMWWSCIPTSRVKQNNSWRAKMAESRASNVLVVLSCCLECLRTQSCQNSKNLPLKKPPSWWGASRFRFYLSWRACCRRLPEVATCFTPCCLSTPAAHISPPYYTKPFCISVAQTAPKNCVRVL